MDAIEDRCDGETTNRNEGRRSRQQRDIRVSTISEFIIKVTYLSDKFFWTSKVLYIGSFDK